MTDTAMKHAKRVWDVTKVVGALATALVAAFGWLEARETAKSSTNDTAAAELKVDKAYSTLSEAVKELAEDNRDQNKTISDLRVAVAELKGALVATRNIRATRMLEDSEVLKDISKPEPEPPAPPDVAAMGTMGFGGGGAGASSSSLAVPARRAKKAIKSALDLPDQIHVEQQAVDQYIEQKKAK